MVESDDYQRLSRYTELPEADRRLVDSYRTSGFVIIEDTGIDAGTIDAALRSLSNKYRHSATGYSEGGRIQDAWRFSKYVKACESILDKERKLYGREPLPFQTLKFQKPTEQRAHSDTVHFNTLPDGIMCGA